MKRLLITQGLKYGCLLALAVIPIAVLTPGIIGIGSTVYSELKRETTA